MKTLWHEPFKFAACLKINLDQKEKIAYYLVWFQIMSTFVSYVTTFHMPNDIKSGCWIGACVYWTFNWQLET